MNNKLKKLEDKFFSLYVDLNKTQAFIEPKEFHQVMIDVIDSLQVRLKSANFFWMSLEDKNMGKKLHKEIVFDIKHFDKLIDKRFMVLKGNYDISFDKENILSFIGDTSFRKAESLYKLLTSDFYNKELPAVELSLSLEQDLDKKPDHKTKIKI